MTRLGCSLMILAMILMLALIVLPVIGPFRDNALLMSLQAAINCPPGYTFENEFNTSRPSPGTTVESATGYCISPEGQRTRLSSNEQERFILIATGAFVIPFLLGTFVVIVGANRATKQKAKTTRVTSFGGIDIVTMGDQIRVNMPGIDEPIVVDKNATSSAKTFVMTSNLSGDSDSLANRLRQLEEARDQGLITAEEYHQLRQEILKTL